MGSETCAREFERKVVDHCAPVLAGIKPASMFSCSIKTASCCGNPHCRSLKPLEFLMAFASCRRRLQTLGIEMTALAQRERGVLILVYRPEQLTAAINTGARAAFLQRMGYDTTDFDVSIAKLAQRIAYADMKAKTAESCSFPHEVGIFLGYPLDDVIGFIENGGDNYLVCGCWKAYSRERDAVDCFCRYKECTAALMERFQAGACIEELAAVKRRAA